MSRCLPAGKEIIGAGTAGMVLERLEVLADAGELEHIAAILTGALADGEVFPAGFGLPDSLGCIGAGDPGYHVFLGEGGTV